MFNFKKVLGLALLSSAAALSGCGGDSGNQAELDVCDEGLLLNEATGQCVARPPVCPDGERFPDDLVIDENTTVDDCEPIPYAGPAPEYFPTGDEAVIYYNRQHIDADYSTTNVYRWHDCGGSAEDWVDVDPSNYPGLNLEPDGIDPVYGAYYILDTLPGAVCGFFIINIDGDANKSADLQIDFTNEGSPYNRMKFFIPSDTGDNSTGEVNVGNPICVPAEEGSDELCLQPAPPVRVITDFAAHWIDETTFAFNIAGGTNVNLYQSTDGGFDQDSEGGIVEGSGVSLVGSLEEGTFTEAQMAAAPQVTGDGWTAYNFTAELSMDVVKSALKNHLLFAMTDGDVERGTFVQTYEVLDALYTAEEGSDTPLAESADLGVTYGDSGITVAVWAPTAQLVELKTYSAGTPKFLNSTESMTLDDATGVWSASVPNSSDGLFFRYDVTVMDQGSGELRKLQTTDPYSVSLSEDGLYSQFVNLSDASLKPADWDTHEIPTVASPESSSVYEAHIRDFSILDASTSLENRGKYLAFTEDSVPVQHLQELVDSGLTHFHVLPTFDIASVVEAEQFQVNLWNTIGDICDINDDLAVCDTRSINEVIGTVVGELTQADPNDADAEALLRAVADADGFNWGYDPHHYNAPEGSYSSEAEGSARVLEMRTMVKALHDMGLRVVMDVVYNHTNASGLDSPKSNFDKIVPGYYHRRGTVSAGVERATCCDDTASENRMFAKFMTESLVQWAEQYKIDGFRFDLMAYHPKPLMESALAAVQAVDEDNYFYGEGWTVAGSSTAGSRFEQSNQPNLSGTGIGTFNDVMRNPLHDFELFKADLWATDDDSDTSPNLGAIDRIRVGLAGNLTSFPFFNAASSEVTGDAVGAYGSDPQENIAHVTVHDNWTLWDYLHLDSTYTDLTSNWDLAARARAASVTLSIPALSQGVSFFHMGTDLLRSKSMERNSFNSGDWFNFVDFTQSSSNFGSTRPWDVDGRDRDIIDAAFADMESLPDAATIMLASDVFNEMLQISSSSALFSLTSADEVNARVGFHNQGLTQTPGLIVMSIDDGTGLGEEYADLDPANDAIVVVFNGTTAQVSHSISTAEGFELHATQDSSVDGALDDAMFVSEVVDDVTVGTFTVPALTTAVFVKPQGAERGVGLSRDASPAESGEVENPFGEGEQLFVRGTIVDWADPAPAENELFYNGDGTFTGFLDIAAGDYSIKIASQAWDGATVNLGGTGSGQEVTLGTPFTLGEADDNNIGLEIPADAEYRFDVNAVDVSSPSLTVRDARGFGDEVPFLRGTIFDWADPSPAEGEIPYAGQGIYENVISVPDGEQSFKIASQAWDGATINLGGTESGVVVTLGEPVLLGAVDDNNLSATFAADDYYFRIDTSDPGAPTLTIILDDPYEATPIFLRGEMFGWADPSPDNAELSYQGAGVYSVDIEIDNESDDPTFYAFKIASQAWDGAAVNLGGTTSGVVVDLDGASQPMGTVDDNNLSIEIPADGTYRFILDQSSGSPVVSVEDVTP